MGDILSNLVGHWPCNDNVASTVVDDAVGSNNGTLAGAGNTSESTVSGPGGSLTAALSLDGTNDYIAITQVDYANNTAFTWSMWFRSSSFASAVYILGRSASAFRYLAATTSTNIELSTSSIGVSFTVPALSTSTWYHLCITRTSGNSVNCYLNGTVSSSGAQTAGGNSTADSFGRRNTNYLNGAVCDVRHYSRALAAGDVTDLYNLGVTSGSVRSPLIRGDLTYPSTLLGGRLILA
jgi:hypothetical protein